MGALASKIRTTNLEARVSREDPAERTGKLVRRVRDRPTSLSATPANPTFLSRGNITPVEIGPKIIDSSPASTKRPALPAWAAEQVHDNIFVGLTAHRRHLCRRYRLLPASTAFHEATSYATITEHILYKTATCPSQSRVFVLTRGSVIAVRALLLKSCPLAAPCIALSVSPLCPAF
jgi:hypothetical protein